MKVAQPGRRKPEEIYAEIIRAASPGTSKTRIMYSARLNYKQLRRYLDHLTVSGLLHSDQGKAIFATTERGKQFLDRYEEMAKLEGELRTKQIEIEKTFPEVVGEPDSGRGLELEQSGQSD